MKPDWSPPNMRARPVKELLFMRQSRLVFLSRIDSFANILYDNIYQRKKRGIVPHWASMQRMINRLGSALPDREPLIVRGPRQAG